MADRKMYKVGITVKEAYDPEHPASYEVLDFVLYPVEVGGDGCSYVAIKANQGIVPGSDDSVWVKATQAGQSIYDLAVKYGHFVGTEEEFEAEYQQVLQDARDAASAATGVEQQVEAAEAQRVAAEQERAAAETLREQAETQRISGEESRVSNETARVQEETARQQAETTRQSNEDTREASELARTQAEELREEAELTREQKFGALETDMETAIANVDEKAATIEEDIQQYEANEQERVQAETERAAAEQARQTAEQGRAAAEALRAEAETARGNAEQARQQAEQSRAQAEQSRAQAETQRGTNEQARQEAETARQTAETARETQATSDHQRAEGDHAIAAEDHATLDEKISHKADIDGSYDGMAVGIARNLEGRTDVTDSFFKRTTGGDAEVANGTAQLNEVKGKSQVWNQLVQNGNFANDTIPTGFSTAYLSRTVSNGICHTTVQSLSAAAGFEFTHNSVPPIPNHKYLISFKIKTYGNYKISSFGCGGKAILVNIQRSELSIARFLCDAPSSVASTGNFRAYIKANEGAVGDDVYDLTDISIIDLTLLGIDNLTTVEEVEAWLAENIGEQAYYPYNPGEVLNNRMTGVESIGFNLLDPATGKADIIGAYSDVYGNYYGITGTHGAITFTDKFGNSETITPDEDGKFLLEVPGELSVADAGEDCAVFLWWDGTQTEYKPYEKNVGALDVTHIYGKLNGEGEYVRVWPTGMPGIGDIKDSLKVVDGQVVAERKIAEVDLGSLETWAVRETYGGFRATFRPFAAQNFVALCSKFRFVGPYSWTEDKQLGYFGGNNIFYKDSSVPLTDEGAAQVKTLMSGAVLYYELETPQVYTDLIYRDSEAFADNTPVTLPVNYKVDNWGIERIAPQNTEEAVVTTKPELTMRYSIDAVEELNTHRDEIDDLYEKNEELEQRKPEKYGEYPDMAVGSAKSIAGDIATDAEFKFRKTGGNNAVASGLAKLTAVYGKSLVWNQLVRNGQFAEGGNTPTYWYNFSSTIDNSNADYLEAHRDNGTGSMCIPTVSPMTTGHKYLVSCRFRRKEAVEGDCYVYGANMFGGQTQQCPTDGSWFYYKNIHECGSTASQDGTGTLYGAIRFVYASGIVMQIDKKVGVNLIDLTLMFGAGNEPATVAEFEAMFPLPYYDYNAGEIISNKAEAVETVGFNQWDEEWELGTFNTTTGANIGSSTQIRSKNLIPVFGGENYYFHYGTNTTLWVMLYDREMNVIDAHTLATGGVGNCFPANNNKEFTLPSDAAFMKFYAIVGYGNTYKNDICINISDPSRNGEYEPYRKYTLPLNIPTLTGKLNGEGESVVIAPEGLKSAGSARDELVIKNGYATSIIKRIGVVDLGTLTWTYSSQSGYFFSTEKIISSNGGNNSVNFVIPYYECLGWDKFVLNYEGSRLQAIGKYAASGTTCRVNILDSRYTDAATFKAAMDGVLLYYELAEPEEYILDEPFYVGYQEDADGTEKRLPEDTASSVMPALPCKIAYPIDVVKTINELGNEYVSTKKVQTFTQEEVAQALANIGLGGMFKYGVVSQTIPWTGDNANGYTPGTPTNVVRGMIPQSFIDSAIALDENIVFNATTGYFEYKGLTNLSYKEMLASYEIGDVLLNGLKQGLLNFHSNKTEDMRLRVLIANASRHGASMWAGTTFNTGIAGMLFLEVLDYGPHMINNVRVPKWAGEQYDSWAQLERLRVLKSISFEAFTSAKDLSKLYSLETCEIFHLKGSLNLGGSSRLSLASVVYMVNYAANGSTAITITLHATAYARCVADTTEYTYNSQTYTGIIALAAAKNITIQSA